MTEPDLKEIGQQYENFGWCIVSLPCLDALVSVRDELEFHLGKILCSPGIGLGDYHHHLRQNKHDKIQMEMARYFWSNNLCIKLARAQMSLLTAFVGVDLHIQQRAYLRVARPNLEADNIGYHRDTLYGQSPYEVAIHVPLMELNSVSCLRFLSGSHIFSESKFDVTSKGSEEWVKGSPKHELGFPYAPKTISINKTDLTAVPLKFGEAIIFSPSIVHGQDVNGGKKTRFTIDFRVVNSFAPIEIRKDYTSRGYIPLMVSSVTKVAESYLAACTPHDPTESKI